jgi:tRNA pseudouridine38-40 synthase
MDRVSDEVKPGFVRVRLDLSYDGKDFSGWAKQAGGRRTVQGEIEDALRTVTRSGTTYELTVAGRTDAGVHARGQVAHVDLPLELWAEHREKLLKRLAGRLSRDVRIWRVAEAPEGFNARFSAIWRRYAYRVTDNPGGVDPLLRGHVLWHDWPLDVAAMNEASAGLVGEHDFAAYCKKRDGATTIRTLQQLSWERDPSGVITATVTGPPSGPRRSWRPASATRRCTWCARTG